MDLKEELRSLLQKGYLAINDLNKTADMTPKQTLLKTNGLNSLRQAKEMIKELHQLVIIFDTHLQNVLQRTVEEKVETLKSHSEEIIQCVEYMSNICLTAENLIKENNLQAVNSFGPKLKAEFLKSLKECRELKMVDYETFTSVDIEMDLSGIFQLPLVKIVSWNHQCLKKETVHSLGFASIDKNILPLSLSKYCHDIDSEYVLSNQTSMKSHKVTVQTNQLIHQQKVDSMDHQTTSLESLNDEVQCSRKPDMLKRITADMIYPREPKTKLQVVSHGDLNSQHAFSKSTSKKSSSSLPQPNRSLEHVQNPTYKHEPRHDLTEISVPVVNSISNNVEMSRGSAPVFQSIKLEVPDDDDNLKKIESALQHNLSLSDYLTAAEQNKGHRSKAVLTSMKIERESLIPEDPDSSMDKLSTLANAHDTTTQPLGFHSTVAAAMTMKNETKGSSYSNMTPWNSFRIEPLKMTFDLRTVMPLRIPKICARLVQTIDGGRCTTFNHPIGVTVNVDGHVVVADTGNHVVKIMNNNTLLFTIGQNDGVLFVRPSAVVTDTEGNIYVKDDRCIQIFDCSGKLLDTVGKSCFSHPYGLTLAKHQTEPILVVLDSRRGKTVVFNYFIRQKRLESHTYGPAEEFNSPFSKFRFLAVHDNVMLVSDLGASCMHLSLLNGQTLRSFGSFGDHVGNLKEPSGIAVDAVGNWIVGDSKNNRLQVYTNDGHVLTVITLSAPTRRPSGIHLTSDGLLYVINYLDSVIKVYDLCH